MGRIYWIRVDGTEEDIEADISDAKANDDFTKITDIARKHWGNWAEMVWVLHKDKRTLMLVDELGAVAAKPGYPLLINPKATEIYHNASRARGHDWVGPPYIHGDVVLFEDIRMK